MKKLIALFLILSQAAFAGAPPVATQAGDGTNQFGKWFLNVRAHQATDLGGIKSLLEDGSRNLLPNPSFEDAGSSGFNHYWTTTKLSGTTFAGTKDTSNMIDGINSYLGTLTSATGEVSQDVTPSPAIQTNGIPMVAACWVKTSATDVQVCSRTGGTDGQCNTVASAGNWVLQPVNFTGPANGTSVGVSVKNTTSGSETFNVDDCYVGISSTPQNFGQVSQATLMGQVKITGCASNWVVASTSLASFPTQSSCVYTTTGLAQAPATNIPAVKFASLPPGNYVIKYEGQMGAWVSSGSTNAYYQFTDGTNTANELSTYGQSVAGVPSVAGSGIQQTITYTTTQSNITLELKGATDTAGSNNRVYGTTANPGVISVYRFPTYSEVAYRPDALPALWSGYDDSISGGCSTSSSGFVDPSSCTSIALHQTNAQGLSCVAASSSAPGIACTFSKTGLYRLYGWSKFSWSSSGGRGGIRVVDGSGTVISPGTTCGNSGTTCTLPFDGLYNVTSTASAITFKVQLGNNNGNTVNIDQGPAMTGDSAIMWNIESAGQNTNSPLLMGSVNTSSTAQDHIERALLTASACSSGTCSLTNNTPGISSIGWNSTGDYTVNFPANTFSAVPTCQVGSLGQGAAFGVCRVSGIGTSTAVTVDCRNFSSVQQNDAFAIICMGPR